jgi:MoxR-like ATPase
MKGILDEYGIEPPPTRIRVEVQGKSHESGQDEIVHPCVAELVSYIARRRHVYVHGPAGGGKTYGAEQACKLVGLDAAVITMPGMTYSKILGFKAADGSDTSSTLLDCFEFGKVAILDEFDRTLPAVAAALNSMLENGKYAIGKRIITKHADFCVIATGNTDLRGGTRVYTSAQPIDYATAARFAFVSWPYDQTHEQSLVRSILPPVPSKALVAWIRKMRANLTRDHIETVLCGPREAYRIAEDVSFGVAIERSAEAWIWRGLDRAVVDRLVRETPYPALAE